MRVVSDTSPLSNLTIIGRLDLLRDQFGSLIIPPAVEEELARFRHPVAGPALVAARSEGWLAVEALADLRMVNLLRRDLDPGESEAIALASATSADWLLMDESEGRAAAGRLGLRVVGVLGILLRAKRDGQSIPSEMTFCGCARKRTSSSPDRWKRVF